MTEELTIQTPRELAPADPFLTMLERVATAPDADITKVEKMLEMMERRQAQIAQQAFADAMRAAQDEMLPVVRDRENNHTHSKYARLETIDAAIRPVYTRHGFSLSFNSADAKKDGAVRVSCRVRHIAGHTEVHELEGDLDVSGAQGKSNKTSIQGLGSSVSYLRRYLTLMIFNVALRDEDDDGNGAAPIVGAQLDTIRGIVAACRMTEEQTGLMLRWLNVPSIEEIQRRDYPRALNALRRKLAELQKAEAAAQ